MTSECLYCAVYRLHSLIVDSRGHSRPPFAPPPSVRLIHFVSLLQAAAHRGSTADTHLQDDHTELSPRDTMHLSRELCNGLGLIRHLPLYVPENSSSLSLSTNRYRPNQTSLSILSRSIKPCLHTGRSMYVCTTPRTPPTSREEER